MIATLIFASTGAIVFMLVFLAALIRDARKYHEERAIKFRLRETEEALAEREPRVDRAA